jgi:hypothetical protein
MPGLQSLFSGKNIILSVVAISQQATGETRQKALIA